MDFNEKSVAKLKVNIKREAICRFSKNLKQLLNFYDGEKLSDMNDNLFNKKIFGENADEEFKTTLSDMMIYFACKGTTHSIPVSTFNLCRMIEKTGHNAWEAFSKSQFEEEDEEEPE